MSREFMKMLAPDVLAGADASARILDRLVGYACALVEHEKARRTDVKNTKAGKTSGSDASTRATTARRR
jgi:hypothetical protein